jgi:hypothetical protein
MLPSLGPPQGRLVARASSTAVAMLVVLAGVFGLLLQQPAASAAGNLSSIILPTPWPGFVEAPPGPYNGPITPSSMALVMGSNSAGLGQAQDVLTSGELTGYLRLWVHQPQNGDAVSIEAFQFVHADAENSFVSGLSSALQARTGATPFPVPGLPDASGVGDHTTSAGAPLVANTVSFVKGDTVYEVTVGSEYGELTAADAISIATNQAASAPDTPALSSPVSWRHRTGEVYGAAGGSVFVFVLILIAMRRRRAPRLKAAAQQPVQVGLPTTITYPPPPLGDQVPGWTFVGEGRQVQWHWDGGKWTGRKMLTPGGWVER